VCPVTKSASVVPKVSVSLDLTQTGITLVKQMPSVAAFYIHSQTAAVADLLSITGLRLVNRDVMQLNLVKSLPLPEESGYGYRT